MKYGIVCAMKEEVCKIVTSLHLKKEVVYGGQQIWTNKNKNIILIHSDIGKVLSAQATTTLIYSYNVDAVINIGIAGGIKEVEPGSAFVINKVRQWDTFVPFEEYQDVLYNKVECSVPTYLDVEVKSLITGDTFATETPNTTYDLIDMEGFAVAKVCESFNWVYATAFTEDSFNINTIIIKGVSDNVDGVSVDVMFDNLNIAMDNSIDILKDILKPNLL